MHQQLALVLLLLIPPVVGADATAAVPQLFLRTQVLTSRLCTLTIAPGPPGVCCNTTAMVQHLRAAC
jgi:hypothetical protein